MASKSGQRCQGCQHCRVYGGGCKFSEVVDFRGIKIYKHETNAASSNGGDTKGEVIGSNISYILHNTGGTDIHSKDIRCPIDEANISCPRCKAILQHAQKLLTRIPSIGKNVVIGICDHCEIQDSLIKTCKKCARVIREFLDSREVDYEIKEKQILPWVTTIQKALQEEFVRSAADTTSHSSWVSRGEPKDLSHKLLVNQRHAFDLATVLRDGHVKLTCSPCDSRPMIPAKIDFEKSNIIDFDFLKKKVKPDFAEFAKQHRVSIQEPMADKFKAQEKLLSLCHSEESLVSIGLARISGSARAGQPTDPFSTTTKLPLRSSLKKNDKLRYLPQAREYYSDEYLNHTDSTTAFQYIFPRPKEKYQPQALITSSELIKQTLEKTFQEKKLQGDDYKIEESSAQKQRQLSVGERRHRHKSTDDAEVKSTDISSIQINESAKDWDKFKFKSKVKIRSNKGREESNDNLEKGDEEGISFKLSMSSKAEKNVTDVKPRDIKEKSGESEKGGKFEQLDFDEKIAEQKVNVTVRKTKYEISSKTEIATKVERKVKPDKETTENVGNDKNLDRGKNWGKSGKISKKDIEYGNSKHNISDKDDKSRREKKRAEQDEGGKEKTDIKIKKRDNFDKLGKERKTDKVDRDYIDAKKETNKNLDRAIKEIVDEEQKDDNKGTIKKFEHTKRVEKLGTGDKTVKGNIEKPENYDKKQDGDKEETKKDAKKRKEKREYALYKNEKGEKIVKGENLAKLAIDENDKKEGKNKKLDKEYKDTKEDKEKSELALDKDTKSSKVDKGRFDKEDRNLTIETLKNGDNEDRNENVIKSKGKGDSSKEASKGKKEKESGEISPNKTKFKSKKKLSKEESTPMVSEDKTTKLFTKSEIEKQKLVQKEEIKRKQEYEKRVREMKKNIQENHDLDDPSNFITIEKKLVEKNNTASKIRDESSQKKPTARENKEKSELRRKLELERKLKEYDSKGVPLLRVVTDNDNKDKETDDVIILTKSQEALAAKRQMDDLILMRQLEERRKAKANKIVIPFTTTKTKIKTEPSNIKVIEVKQEEKVESEDEFEDCTDDFNRDRYTAPEIIVDTNIYQYTKELEDELAEQGKPLDPMLFKVKAEDIQKDVVLLPDLVEIEKSKPKLHEADDRRGVISYALSDRSFVEKGWTLLPTEKVVRKVPRNVLLLGNRDCMNIYRMSPAQPQFDWFDRNKSKGTMYYDCGERLAEFENNKTARWYYRNGRPALEYYEAEEANAQMRVVVYSSGEPDERGRNYPVTILATFDYIGNGIVFDHTGKIRMKYNQTEGVMLDRSVGPVTQWKWHSLNDPPILQQVMIDNELPIKDETITNLTSPDRNRERPDNEQMLLIEYDNYIKEKNKKATRKFKPFQIKMKALKINENFSLKVLDQASVYLHFRDGTTSMKLNLGMKLNNKEIIDSDTVEVGYVANPLEKLPAKSASLARMKLCLNQNQQIKSTF